MPHLTQVRTPFHRLLLLAVVTIVAPMPLIAAEPIEIHHSPIENLERLDVALIDEAETSLDVAAYILTDRPVIDALILAKERGVILRILLDPSQKSDFVRLAPLEEEIRLKRKGPIMHLKAYVVDGERLRTGSANLTASGLKQQDNDRLVISVPSVVAAFRADLERMWTRAVPITRAQSGDAAPNRLPASPASGREKTAGAEAPAVKVVSGRKRPRRAIARKRYDQGSKK